MELFGYPLYIVHNCIIIRTLQMARLDINVQRCQGVSKQSEFIPCSKYNREGEIVYTDGHTTYWGASS